MLVAGLAHADSVRYVTDQLNVMLRSGTSTRHQIIQQVPTGTSLTVLQTDPQSGYSQVRTPSGTEGWLLTRYLTDKRPPRIQLAAAEKKLSALENTVTNLRQQLSAATQKSGGDSKKISDLTLQNNTLTQQLAELRRVSGNAVQIADENSDLKSRITELEREGQLLRQENASLKDRSKRDWFIVGAIVVVASMLFGILLTRIRWRKRSSWGEL